MFSDKLLRCAEETVQALKEKNLKVATAESCTGGLVSAALTCISGVSEVFELGVTSYSCRIKNEVLGVNKETLETLGAISEDTAKQMAENVRNKANSDLGLSVTGVAGPNTSEGHPVGYIFIAVSGKLGTRVELLELGPESRDALRETAAIKLFELTNKYIKDI